MQNPIVSRYTIGVLSQVIGVYDPRLVALSAIISLSAAFTTLEILDHIAVSRTWRRLAWSCVAAITSALGIWSMQCIITLSLHRHVILTYDVQIEAASLAAGLLFSFAGAYIINARDWGMRRVAVGGVLFGIAIILSNALGVLAMQLDGHTMYRTSMFIAAATMALASSIVAVLVGTQLGNARAVGRLLMRLTGSVLFALGMMGAYFYLMSGVNVSSMMPFIPADSTHLPLAIAIALATMCIVIGSFAGVRLDDHASFEQKRAHHLSYLYTRERLVSTTLQKALLPARLPDVAGISFSSVYLPHSHEAYVGGDWYDAFLLADGRIACSIGDVAGHGLSAALTMNIVRHALRACAMEDPTPSYVLTRTNRILIQSDHPAIVTAVFAVLDPKTLELEFACAGHAPPLVIAPQGIALPRVYGDPPIGILEDFDCIDRLIVVPVGGLIAFYTDGCTEYDRDIIKGEHRLTEVATEVLKLGVAEPAKAIAERLFAKRDLKDDAAIFCIHIEHDITRPFRHLIDTVTGEEAVLKKAPN